jgi:glycosyltransferase involved in cell wall biosynthesis
MNSEKNTIKGNQKISGIIITYNEEVNIRRCLESLQGVVDEIVVVDSNSTDRTEEICREFNVKFISQQFLGYRDQKNFALDQASFDYVLSLDADEALSDRAREIIIREKENMRYDAYRLNRFNNYCGKWIKHGLWYPDTTTRLWNKHRARFGGMNIHEYVETQKGNSIKHLGCDILHYSFKNIHEHIMQINKFAKIHGELAHENGRKNKSVILNLILNPLFKFIRGYIFKLGFLDGYYGFVISVNASLMNYFKYLYLLEINRKNTLKK